MRLETLGDRDTWSGLALEAVGHVSFAAPPKTPLSWDVPEEISVVWPISYDWEHAAKWVEPLRRELASLADLRCAEIAQPFTRVVLAEVEAAGARRRVAIDYADSVELNGDAAAQADIYFKMQYRNEGYDAPHVVKGGFVSNGDALRRYLGPLRRLPDRSRLRYDVYGAFSPRYASELRHAAVEALSGDPRFVYEGGFTIARYSAHLWKTARSKVCVDLPGNGPFCFRLVDYLAVGVPILAAPHGAQLHIPLQEGVHLLYASDGLADLGDAAAALVDDEPRRNRLASAARAFYDCYLHPRQLAAYYLHTTMSFAR
jgi:hypothetical protein